MRSCTRGGVGALSAVMALAVSLAACAKADSAGGAATRGPTAAGTAPAASPGPSAAVSDGSPSGTAQGGGADLTVVATTTILADLTRQLLGEDGTVDSLMGVGADPHDFTASAAQAESLRTADLVVANGFGLEEGILDVLAVAEEDGANLLEAGDVIEPIAFGDDAPHGEEGDEHSEEGEQVEEGDDHGHDAGGGDPHFWQDPLRMAEGVRAIAAALAEVDDTLDDAEWAARGASLATELEALDAEIVALLEPIPEARRVLVTNHEAFGYFADRYSLEVIGTVIPGGDSLAEPSAVDLEDLVAAIREHDIPAIFAENTLPSVLADAVAAEVGEEIAVVELFSDSLGEPGSGGETYLQMMATNARRIADALSA